MNNNSNYGKKIVILLSISLLTTICLILFSCSKLENTPPSLIPLKTVVKSNNTSKLKLRPRTAIESSPWQEQIHYIKSDQNILSKNGIKFLSFHYKRELTSIQDVELIKAEILSEQNLIPYSQNNNIFELRTISEVLKANLAEKSRLATSIIKNVLDSLVKPGMEILIFKWLHKGKEFSSICVVKKGGGIVYENLISNVQTLSIEEPKEANDYPAFNAKVSRSLSSDPEPGDCPKAINYFFSSGHYTYSNYWGTEVARAYATLQVTGTKVCNGTKSIINNVAYAYHNSEPGYGANSVVAVAVHPNNGTLQFSWGVAVSGSSASLTFTFSGGSITAPSGTGITSAAGTFSVSPSMLN